MGLISTKEKKSVSFEISSDQLIAVSIEKGANLLNKILFNKFSEDVFQNGYLTDQEEFRNLLVQIKAQKGFNTKKASITLPSNIAFIKIINLPALSFDELCIVVPQEAEKHIPFSLASVNIDFEITKEITDLEGKVVEYEAMLVVIPKDIVKEYVDIFASVGYELTKVDIASFSSIKTFAHNSLIDESDSLSMSVFIGYDNTDMLIIKKGMPIFFYNIPIGKKNVLEEMPVTVNSDMNNANDSLYEVDLSSSASSGIEFAGVAESIKSIYGNITSEVLKVIEFYYSQSSDSLKVEKLILSGSGAGVKGLDLFFSEKVKMPAEICNAILNFEQVEDIELSFDLGDEDSCFNNELDSTVSTLTPSIGLALKG